MIAYVKGILETKTNTYIIVDVGGIGYKIFMSLKSIEKLENEGSIVKVHTYYHVREDNISLYGFITNEELRMFELLLQVSGVGAKSAITMLSQITPSSFALAIISNDETELTKIPGIGKKTVARIILELKDKLKAEQEIGKNEEVKVAIKNNDIDNEAIAALQVLGYTKKEIDKALAKIDKNGLKLEDIIKQALLVIGR